MKSSIAKVLEELKLLNGKFDKLEALKAEVAVVSSGWRRKAVLGKKKKKRERGKVLKAKNDLRKYDITILDLPEGSKIFVNQILCSHYRLLWSISEKLHGKGRIFGWYVSKGSIKRKLQKNSQPLYISHMRISKSIFLI